MAASRCPSCDSALTATEAAAGVCPDCAATLIEEPAPISVAEVVSPTPPPARSRWPFAAGLLVGVLLAASGAAGAWWIWGPLPLRADTAAAAVPVAAPARPSSEELARQVEVVELARVATERTNAERAASEQELNAARDRLQVTLDGLAAAEAERSAAEARLKTVQGKEAEPAVAKARAAIQKAETQRVAAERALADVLGRLQAAKAREEQARQTEAAVRNTRTELERALADVRNKLQASRDQQAEADRQLAAARARLQAAKDQAAAADREVAERKTRITDLDRTIQAKAARATPRSVAAPVVSLKPSEGFVRDWLVVGPFPAPDRKGHTVTFPPETDPFDLKKEYKAGAATLHWQTHPSSGDYVDFAKLFHTEDPAVAYAICWVRSDRARRVVLSLGSNDGIKVWVGGKSVADVGVFRSASPGQDRASCELAAGWNEVRVKIDNQGGPWGFYFEVRDPATNRPATGLEFTTTPPDPKGKK